MTIKEYKELHGLSGRGLAKDLGVCQATVEGWLRGNGAQPHYVELLKSFGIEHTVYTRNSSAKFNEQKMKERDEVQGILKYFQIQAVKHLGNTIVSKKHTIPKIVEEFERFGLKVNVRNFINTHQMEGCQDTHYVVELKKEGEL